MPLELGVWRIDNGDTQPVEFAAMDFENRLEDILHKNIDIASPNWLIIGRQVPTDYGESSIYWRWIGMPTSLLLS